MKLDKSFKLRCEGIAVEQRRLLGLLPYDPLPADMLLMELNGRAVPPDQIPGIKPESAAVLIQKDDWSAGILRRHPLLIVYHPAHSPVRYQSNLMHELAHVLLDHPMVDFDRQTGLPMRDPRYEDEATYLGGCLQIPRSGLQWAAQQGYVMQQIAAYFGASEEMVRFRCNMTGINIVRYYYE